MSTPVIAKADVRDSIYLCDIFDGKNNSSWGKVSVTISEPAPNSMDGLFHIAFKASDDRIPSVEDVPATIEKLKNNRFEVVFRQGSDMQSVRTGIQFGFSTETDRSKALIVILADRPSEHFETAGLVPVASGVCLSEVTAGTV